jgi:hypothetical protein
MVIVVTEANELLFGSDLLFSFKFLFVSVAGALFSIQKAETSG